MSHDILLSSLSDEYETIAEKALTTPANTEQLMDLKAYIEKVEKETIFQLEKQLYQVTCFECQYQ